MSFQTNIDLCLGEVDKIIEESTESSPLLGNVVEPYIGMEFKSRGAAREFYVVYGRYIGFTVRIYHNRRSRINNMDEKDQRIRELTQKLNNEKQKCKQRCAAYQEQICTILKFVEEHTDRLPRRVQDIVKNLEELEEA